MRLRDTGADGFIPAATLGADYFRFEEARGRWSERARGETFRLGDTVEVKLVEAAPFAGALRFEMLSKGGARRRGRGRSGGDDARLFRSRGKRPNGAISASPCAAASCGRCPHCGEGRLFRAYLKVVDACPVCGEDLVHQRADDAPAYFTMLIVGHFIIAGVLPTTSSGRTRRCCWAALVWAALTVAASLAVLLPRIKGALVGYQWAMRMHGFGGPEKDFT